MKKTLFFLSLVFIFLFSGCSEKKQEIQILEIEKSIAESTEKIEKDFSDSIKIGVITDVHKCEFRSPGKITSSRIQSFVEDVDSRNTDFNIDLGDNIRYRLEGCDNEAPEELAWMADQFKTQSPFYHVLSDHDVDDLKSFEYWKETTKTPETYYSFDVKDFHIIVLDTVSGDGQLDPLCLEGSECEKAKKAYHSRRDVLKNALELEKYLVENNTTEKKLVKERNSYENQFKALRNQGLPLKEIEKRDAGSILESQLSWLENDLNTTDKQKIVIFSDHPLIEYQGKRKLYKIVNQKKVQQILENSDKKIIAVNGETHEWSEFEINGVQYYLIGKFSDSPIGEWAVLGWDNEGVRLEIIEK